MTMANRRRKTLVVCADCHGAIVLSHVALIRPQVKPRRPELLRNRQISTV
ncbi:HNH endonuclease [Nocardia sp. NPDC004711]